MRPPRPWGRRPACPPGVLPLALLAVLAGCPQRSPPEAPVPDQAAETAPSSPLAALEQGAESLDPTLRARSIFHLVAHDPGAWAQRGLHDPEPWVQRAAVQALARRWPETRELLEGYVARDDAAPYVRAAAAVALAARDATGPVEALSAAWRAEPRAFRRAPLALAAAVLGDETALEPLSAAIASGDIALEVDFVLDVGASGLTALVPALQEGADWVEPELALPYAAARLALGDVTAEGVLREALSSADVQVRLEALDYLTRIGGPAAEGLLRRIGARSDEVRWYADLALVARGEGDPEELEEAAAHPEPAIRALAMRFAAEAAVDAVGERERKVRRSARRAVRLGLADEDATVRIAALRALQALGLDGERPAVQALLADEYPTVRVEAAGLLI